MRGKLTVSKNCFTMHKANKISNVSPSREGDWGRKREKWTNPLLPRKTIFSIIKG
jgi:hypothetical protein